MKEQVKFAIEFSIYADNKERTPIVPPRYIFGASDIAVEANFEGMIGQHIYRLNNKAHNGAFVEKCEMTTIAYDWEAYREENKLIKKEIKEVLDRHQAKGCSTSKVQPHVEELYHVDIERFKTETTQPVIVVCRVFDIKPKY